MSEFTYDTTYLPEVATLAIFRENVEAWRMDGKPDSVEVLFFDDHQILVVHEYENQDNIICIKVKV